MNPKKELLWSLWVDLKPSTLEPVLLLSSRSRLLGLKMGPSELESSY